MRTAETTPTITARSGLLLSLLLLLLGACQGGHDGGRVNADTTAGPAPHARGVMGTTREAADERAGEHVIRGEATYRERIKTPPGATLDVRLLDLSRPLADKATLASATMRDVAGPPIPFSLPYRAAAVNANRRYALQAELRGPDGELWFRTATPTHVMPGTRARIELLLHRVTEPAPAPGQATRSAHAALAHWECGELGVMSRFDEAARRVRLAFNGRSLVLPLATSASGARYADTRGNGFSTRGAGGVLTLAGEPARDCVPARQASPWNEAAARGVAFRAVGNEPGWFVEVGAGAAPSLRAELDYGGRRIQLAQAHPEPDGFSGIANGQPVRLRIQRAACRDGMSGQEFEADATLTVGRLSYRGCGAYLDD